VFHSGLFLEPFQDIFLLFQNRFYVRHSVIPSRQWPVIRPIGARWRHARRCASQSTFYGRNRRRWLRGKRIRKPGNKPGFCRSEFRRFLFRYRFTRRRVL
jgi:hypothetical protein